MDREHEHDLEAQAAWALAATADDAGRILTTLNGCADCAAEAAKLRGAVDWLGSAQPVRPPSRLRDAVLASARASRRTMRSGSLPALAYATQVEALDALLAGLSPVEWRAPVPRHGDVRGVIAHLTANDEMVAADLGLPESPGRADGDRHVRQIWRDRASMVLDQVPAGGADKGAAEPDGPADPLDRPVRLAGKYHAVRPLRDGLVQRAFETWTHADDVRAVMDLPPRPPPADHLRLITELGVRLLPTALAAVTPGGGEWAVRLVLHGPGGGTWDLPPGRGPGRPPEITISTDVVEFCRLLANRREPTEFAATVAGDPARVRIVMRAVASLGCGD
jgi:uncharacterized protein (TIGR03083 family)